MPVMFHRVSPDAEGLHVCHACGGSLTDVVTKDGCEEDWTSSALDFQRRVAAAIGCGWGFPIERVPVHVLPYLFGLRLMARLFLSGIPAGRLCEVVARKLGVDPPVGRRLSGEKVLEKCRVDERMMVMAGLEWMMAGWPDNFIDGCREAHVRYSDLFRNKFPPPYWLHHVAREHLLSKQPCGSGRKKGGRKTRFQVPRKMVPIPVLDGLGEDESRLLEWACVSWYRARRVAGLRTRSVNRDLRCVYGFIRYIGKPPWCCDERDIDRWSEEIGLRRQLKPDTQRTYLGALKWFLEHLGRQRWFRRDCPVLELPRVSEEQLIPHAPGVRGGNVAKDGASPGPVGVVEAQESSSDVRTMDDREKLERCLLPVRGKRNKICDCCGRGMPKATRIFEGKSYCGTCYAREFAPVPCGKCGATVRTLGGRGPAICQRCEIAGRKCIRCGKPVPRASLTLENGVACASCAKYFKPPVPCAKCGAPSRHLARAFKLGIDAPVCPKCRKPPKETCSICGKSRAVRQRGAEGKPICWSCVRAREAGFLCPKCGRRGIRRNDEECEDCYWNGRFQLLVNKGLESLSVDWVREGWSAYAKERARSIGSNRALLKLKKHLPLFQLVDRSCRGDAGTLDLDALFMGLGSGGLASFGKPWRALSDLGLVPPMGSKTMDDARCMERCREMLRTAEKCWYGTILEGYWTHLLRKKDAQVAKGWETAGFAPRTLAAYMKAAVHFLEFMGDPQAEDTKAIPLSRWSRDFYNAYPGYTASILAFVKYLNIYQEKMLRS